MVQFLSPEVRTVELQTKVRNIRGVPTSIGGLVGIAEKGPIGVAISIQSFEDYYNIFGGQITDSNLYWAVKGFYDNCGEGNLLWIVRTAHYTTIDTASTLTALAAKLTVKDTLGVDTMLIEGSSEGTWGNALQVTLALASRFTHTTTADLLTGGDRVPLASVEAVRIGSVITLDDGVDEVDIVVTKIENKTIFFDAVTLAATIDTAADAIERSFDLDVYLAGELVEQYPFVSMEDTNERFYVENVINAKADIGLSQIRVTDLDSASDAGADRPLATTAPTYLAGGDDGLTSLNDGDYVGSSVADNGLYAFTNIQPPTLNMLGVPEAQTQVVQQGIMDFCELQKFPLGILNSPLALNATGAVTYVNTTLAANTSRSAFFWPQIKVYDATIDNARIIPADGHIMGVYARVDGSEGIQQVGAGELGQLRGIVGFETDFAQKKGYRDQTYPQNINSLTTISSLGRVIYGSRTLSKSGGIGTQINERRVFSFVEESLERAMQWVLFKNNTPELRDQVENTIAGFLGLLLQDGVLEDFYVDVGIGLNNALVRASGKLVAAVGLKVPDTIEFFELQVSKDTRALEAAIEELIA